MVQLLNSSGTVTKTYDYEAFGNPITGTATDDGNPYRYCGEYYDFETGFIYLRARYYDPNTGRFISVDPAKDGLNWYAYCNNNPLSYVDSSGLEAKSRKMEDAPGVLYDTMDEAAIGFANYINEQSISENKEYCTYIYAVRDEGFFKSFGRWFSRLTEWLGGDFIIVDENDIDAKYAFIMPVSGSFEKVDPPTNWLLIYEKVAEMHTHGAYDSYFKVGNDTFSDVDKETRYISYLATPRGTVKKYTPSSGKICTISFDVPFDEKHPKK